MRFMLIMGGAAANVMDVELELSVEATGSTPGLAYSGWGTTQHSSMITCGNGTVLIANGYQPMIRMRQNEKVFTLAGVPAPLQQPRIMSGEELSSVLAETGEDVTDPLLKTWRFDFSEYGEFAGYERTQKISLAFQGGGTSGVQQFTGGYPSGNGLFLTDTGKVSFDKRTEAMQNFLTAYGTNALGLSYFLGVARKYKFTGYDSPTHVYPFIGPIFTAVLQRPRPAVDPALAANRWWAKTTFEIVVSKGDAYSTYSPTSLYNGRYQTFMRYIDKDGNASNHTPPSEVTVLTNASFIRYENLEVPTDDRIKRRQIFRNISGDADWFYLDIDTDDLTSTSLDSLLTDDQLKQRYGLPVFDENGIPLFALYGVPPQDKPFIVEYNQRVFAFGFRKITDGVVSVEHGSDQVTGVGTGFGTAQIGQKIIIEQREYTVTDVVDQVITIDKGYEGSTNPFAQYVILPYFANKNLFSWSGLGYPEAWGIKDNLLLPEDNDDATGGVVFAGAMWILKSRSIKQFTYTVDPLRDGNIDPAANRGCVNARCAVMVQNNCLMLDRVGIHVFKGNMQRYNYQAGDTENHLSLPVGDLFRLEGTGIRLNWKANKDLWHAVHCQEMHTVRWHVALQGYRKPYHAICYDYLSNRWWLEQYPIPITSSCLLADETGKPVLGSLDGKVYYPDTGSLDFVEPGGTYFSVADTLSPYRIQLASEPAMDLTGMTIGIVKGRGHGQYRTVVAHSGDEIEVDIPLSEYPDEDSTVQVGAIPYTIITPVYDFAKFGYSNRKAVRMKFSRRTSPVYAGVTVYMDGIVRKAASDADWGTVSSTSVEERSSRYGVDMTLSNQADVNVDKFMDGLAPHQHNVQAVITGFSGDQRPELESIVLAGAANNPEAVE